MIHLLDVNALIALGCVNHAHHLRVKWWLHELQANDKKVRPATCAITELGFVRVTSGRAALIDSVSIAQLELRSLKHRKGFIFLGDELAADALPKWVTKPNQTTDGHLLELAATHGAQLATLDTCIPGALLIPERTHWMLREPLPIYGAVA
jgi:predicted nucleic acid-binding protein